MKSFIQVLCIGSIVLSCNTPQKKTELKHETNKILQNKKEPTKPEETEIWSPQPKEVVVDSKTGIPSDAIVLFDGSSFNEWIASKDSTTVKWHLNTDGSMTVKDKTGDIQTKRNFGSVQLHIEWRSNPENKASGQNRSNSGVFLQNRYEVQVLDNNNNDTYVNGQVASIYKQAIPLAKASSKTGEWNSYDIIFNEPIFDASGKVSKHGVITVLHNGVLVQNHVVLQGTTEYIGWPKNKPHGKQPIRLQDHHDNSGVSYRNIWVREL